ncbi:hypothetical protein Tco_1570496, partial [Tanacetum coccineum]
AEEDATLTSNGKEKKFVNDDTSRNSGIVIEENVNLSYNEQDDSDSDVDSDRDINMEEMFKGNTNSESEYSDSESDIGDLEHRSIASDKLECIAYNNSYHKSIKAAPFEAMYSPARDRQKSYADRRRKLLEFQVGDKVMLKVSPWKECLPLETPDQIKPRS